MIFALVEKDTGTEGFPGQACWFDVVNGMAMGKEVREQ